MEMPEMCSTLVLPRTRFRRLTPAFAVLVFFVIGMLETVVALAVFQRSDDHQYFVALADFGADAVSDSNVGVYDLKARVAANVFHFFATPVRWLGGGDVSYLMWLRSLFLIGVLCAFEGVWRLIRGDGEFPERDAARARFMILCLLYPGQLAWTASLLRDGLACALLFLALFAWAYRWRVFALLPFVLGLTLRPEFALIAILVAGAYIVFTYWNIRSRGIWMLAGVIAMSLVLYVPRQAASQFSLLAFGDDGAAYPAIDNLLDVAGYFLVAIQGLIDPLQIGAPANATLFGLAETVFFLVLLLMVGRGLSRANARVAGLLIGGLLSLWLFAYFEIFVSGYSRHRVAIVVFLLALLVCSQHFRYSVHWNRSGGGEPLTT